VFEKIEQLKNYFPILMLQKRGEIKWFAEKTGYSRTQVGDIFAGRRTYTERFRKMALDAVQNRMLELGKMYPSVDAKGWSEDINKRVERPVYNVGKREVKESYGDVANTGILNLKETDDFLSLRFGPEMVAMIAQNKNTIMKMIEPLTFMETQEVIGYIAKILSDRNNATP
jgi:hypothetical protein